ncbi:hypothetical protein BLOT_016603 [Blomia tropicalis]|nr:hypothetical protein BLOT_016603 [Blomia tropicalis]
MAIIDSYDPLYPLRAQFFVSGNIYQLFELDTYQYLMSISGKMTTFSILESRLEKLDIYQQTNRIYLIIACIIILLWSIQFVTMNFFSNDQELQQLQNQRNNTSRMDNETTNERR